MGDFDLPTLEELPGDLRLIAEVCQRIVGDPALAVRVVVELVQECRGINIYCRSLDDFFRRQRDRQIRAEFDRLTGQGLSARQAVTAIVRSLSTHRYPLVERSVWRVLGSPDERQMGLF
ncbi:MAG: hypothetical protein AB1413_12470 [Thermodesulfobacteriota bacterium]